MGLWSNIVAFLIRIWHVILCGLVLFGALFCTNFNECFFILGLLVFIIVSQRVYDRCVFTEYEKADGFPSLSEIMRSILVSKDASISLPSFELMLGNLFVFLLLFRMTSMVIIPPKILFA